MPQANTHEFDSFFKTALTYKGSITPKVLPKVLLFLLYSIAVAYVNLYYPSLSLPIGPFEYAGLAMGLVLVFRLNTGYERWSEARKLWGNIVNTSRNFAMTLTGNCKLEGKDKAELLIDILSKFVSSIKTRLVQEDQNMRDPQYAERPLIYSQQISQNLSELKASRHISGYMHYLLETKRSELIDSLGGCERILKTPIPFMMAVKSRRFILLFLVMLPFALVNSSNAFTPMINALVSYTLLALDQIAVEMQRPFSIKSVSHLPLSSITETIDANLSQLK